MVAGKIASSAASSSATATTTADVQINAVFDAREPQSLGFVYSTGIASLRSETNYEIIWFGCHNLVERVCRTMACIASGIESGNVVSRSETIESGAIIWRFNAVSESRNNELLDKYAVKCLPFTTMLELVPASLMLDELMDALSLGINATMNAATATTTIDAAASAVTTAITVDAAAAIATDIAVVSAGAAATATTTNVPLASDIRSCSHGSTSDHFLDGISYRIVIHDYILAASSAAGVREFFKDYGAYFTDSNFTQYIFALCTSWYLKTNGKTDDMESLIHTAILMNYLNDDKVRRYQIEIKSGGDRGMINCLSRETKMFCNCMKGKKKEAQGMDKQERCTGCYNIFPKEDMTVCSGCNYAVFCSDDCYEKYWPAHKEICEGFQKANATMRKKQAALRELAQDEE